MWRFLSTFSVRSFEPQMEGLSSDIIVTVGAPPEDSAETLSSTSRSLPTLSFYSVTPSLYAGCDDFSHEIFEYQSSSSCETSRSRGPIFRRGNKGNYNRSLFSRVSDHLETDDPW